jgi:hypothetical protein
MFTRKQNARQNGGRWTFVGWVERSDTHQGIAASYAMGIAGSTHPTL